ncbi:MAG: hypothetical protein ABIH34_06705 [Nanoarchaeota archaeon]
MSLHGMMSGILAFLSLFWSLFVFWLSIFLSPFRHPNSLWIIIPIWLAWFFAEFFQEKKKTSFGNAISNGVIPLWVSVDWTRMLIFQLNEGTVRFGWPVAIKFFICLLVFAYGLTIIIGGIRTKQFIHYIGRIREVTYVLVVFTPIIYGIMEMSWTFFLSIILFFPVFYFIFEFINKYAPTPKALRDEEDEKGMP